MKHVDKPRIVLAIDATARGFGWVVFEGRQGLIDLGTREARGDKNRESVRKVAKLLRWYKPDTLVLEDALAKHSRRHARIKRLHRDLADLAKSLRIEVAYLSRGEINTVFEVYRAKTRHIVAGAIAVEFPFLASWLPPRREIWRDENPRLSVFNAAALAIAFFELKDNA
jgi:hypothetical protein